MNFIPRAVPPYIHAGARNAIDRLKYADPLAGSDLGHVRLVVAA
jgi:hypothetical protein